MNQTINNATKEVIQYNRIGGTPENPIYYNDPIPTSSTPLTQTAIPVSDLQGVTPIKVPNITPPRNETPAIVAQADQSVVNYQEAQRRADELLKTQGNTAQNERSALNKLAQDIFGQKSDIIGSQAQREKDLGITEQQKALAEVNSQIADTTIQLRAEQDRVRNTPMSQSQKAVELGVIEDTYGRRLTDMAIRQSAAQGNISAIREESDRQTRLLIAPLDNKLQYLTTFAKENVDALDKKEQQRLNLIIQDVQSQKEDVKALQSAKVNLVSEVTNNGGGTNTNLIARIQGAKTIDEAQAIASQSGFIGKLDRQIKQAQLAKIYKDMAEVDNPQVVASGLQQLAQQADPNVNRQAIASILSGKAVSAGTKARLAPANAVMNAVAEITANRQSGEFVGIGLFGRAKEFYKGLVNQRNPEADKNYGDFSGLNLKTEQWGFRRL